MQSPRFADASMVYRSGVLVTTLQISFISGSAGLWLGYIGCSFFDLYRKGGQRDLENWLDEEIELNIELLKQVNDLTEGAREGASDNPGHVDALASSPAWLCDKRGHRFIEKVIDGLVVAVCRHCDLPKEPA